MSHSYAVLDVETTGLDRQTDRIVEIAVIQLGPDLAEEQRWHSLINPERPIGASHIHGLADADLTGSPTFADVAGELYGLLHGRLIVAHNAAFERAFLNLEFSRAGLDQRVGEASCVCTMDQSRVYLPPGGHSLSAVARRLGVVPTGAHRAMHDAVTCAGVLRAYIEIESRGGRYCDWATDRNGEVVLPAQWTRAHEWVR